jgi:hypothetical protein
MTSVFLSYARGDDEPFVRRLYEHLTKSGFSVWLDRVSMPSRQLTFYQEIRDAIAARDRLVLVVGPKAITSDYVAQEWRFAYFEALKCVNPIVRLDSRDAGGKSIDAYALIPKDLRFVHAEDFRRDDEFEAHAENLIRQLSEALPPAGKLVAVPDLPPHFVAQPDRIKALRDILLADLTKPVVVSGAAGRVGVQGMGGIGKSVLASALAHRPEVRRAFPDGVYWVTLGQKPHIGELLRSLLKELGDESIFTDVESGKQKLREALVHRAALLVLDDGWQRPHAEAFNVTGPRCRLLLTTRDAGLVTALASRENHYQVQLPSMAEAKALLTKAAGTEGALPPQARTIIEECGRLPLALALTGGMVLRGVPWTDVLEALRQRDLKYISDRHPLEERHASVWRAIDASVHVLGSEERQRFIELAVFALDTGAPEAAVLTFWEHTAGLQPRYARALLGDLAERSLVERDEADGRIKMHDLIHNFATGMAEKRFGEIARLHKRLLDAYEKKCTNGWPTGPDDGYFFASVAFHLLLAKRGKELVALLFDFRWLKAKIESTAYQSLQYDFALLLRESDTQLENETRNSLEKLRNFIGPLRFSEQLPTAIWGHFADSEDQYVRRLLRQARDLTVDSWLRPITPSLASPLSTLIQAINFAGTSMVNSLTIGDTVSGYPIVAAVTDDSPRLIRIWIGGIPMRVVPVPSLIKIALPSLSEILSVRATNLPGDGKPALLLSWNDSSHGNCCSIWDLSRATFDISDKLAGGLSQIAVDHRDPLALGPVMLLGHGEPISLGRIMGRPVLLAYESASVPWLVGEDGEAFVPDFSAIDERLKSDWRDLLLQNDAPEPDYLARLNRMAKSLSSLTKERISVFPKKKRSARAVIHDIETGKRVSRIHWSEPGRPVLVGEDDTGRPFLVHTVGGDLNLALSRLGAKSSILLSNTHFLGDQVVLSDRRGRPVIVKGGFDGIEVVDATNGKCVGHFLKHLDNERLLAAGVGEDGSRLVASVGELSSRGRFSTSVRIWDVETQTQISRTGESHTGKICAVTSANIARFLSSRLPTAILSVSGRPGPCPAIRSNGNPEKFPTRTFAAAFPFANCRRAIAITT